MTGEEGKPILREFLMDLVEIKRKLDKHENLIIDSEGKFEGQKGFGKTGIFIIIQLINQPLKYASLDIQKILYNLKRTPEEETIVKLEKSSSVNETSFKESNINKNSEHRTPISINSNIVLDIKNSRHMSSELKNKTTLNDLDKMLSLAQSQKTTKSQNLRTINRMDYGKLLKYNDILQEWSGKAFKILNEGEDSFTRNLLNLPFGYQTIKDHGVISIVKEMVGTKDLFVTWDFSGPFTHAKIPHSLIFEIVKRDFDFFFDSLIKSVSILEKLQTRICECKLVLCTVTR